jgi:hypothetical protein
MRVVAAVVKDAEDVVVVAKYTWRVVEVGGDANDD